MLHQQGQALFVESDRFIKDIRGKTAKAIPPTPPRSAVPKRDLRPTGSVVLDLPATGSTAAESARAFESKALAAKEVAYALAKKTYPGDLARAAAACTAVARTPGSGVHRSGPPPLSGPGEAV